MKPSVESIAESVARNGRWGRRSMRRGWKWLKADRRSLEKLLEERGCQKADTDEWHAAYVNLKQQIEWSITH